MRNLSKNILILCVVITCIPFFGASCSNDKPQDRAVNDQWYKQKILNDIVEGRDINSPLGRGQYTHLHEAALGDYIESAKLLISKGAYLDTRAGMQETPLHRAAQKGSIQVAQLLIQNGADVEARDESGESPLFFAVGSETNTLEMMSMLIEAGADINVRDKYGNTPIIKAGFTGNIVAINILLMNGADVNQVNNKQYSALHKAAWYGRHKAVKKLLEKGADVNSLSKYNETSLDCALKSMEAKEASAWGKRRSVSLIKKYGGKKASENK
jgi:ankyrin repeat protein